METREMGVRQFGRVNWLGAWTLTEREVRRFLNVWSQTVMAPLINAGLFLLIFSVAIGPGRGEVMGVSMVQFLVPGILTMTVIQNAFANTASSLASAKVQGNIVDTLMPPLSASELVAGYIAGAVVRGLIVGMRHRAGQLACARRRARPSPVGPDIRRAGLGDDGRARAIGRDHRPEVRPAFGDHQLHRHAAVVPVGDLLFDRRRCRRCCRASRRPTRSSTSSTGCATA